MFEYSKCLSVSITIDNLFRFLPLILFLFHMILPRSNQICFTYSHMFHSNSFAMSLYSLKVDFQYDSFQHFHHCFHSKEIHMILLPISTYVLRQFPFVISLFRNVPIIYIHFNRILFHQLNPRPSHRALLLFLLFTYIAQNIRSTSKLFSTSLHIL